MNSEQPPDATNIVELARGYLMRHPHFHGHASSITIDAEGDRIVLTGRLPSYYLKQVLQEALGKLAGVSQIENRVLVVSSDGLSDEFRDR